MEERKKFTRWQPKNIDYSQLTPIIVRDLVVECFYVAQYDMFRHLRLKIKDQINEQDIQQRIVAAVRYAFNEVNGDFDEPTKPILKSVVDFLVRKALAWGTPPDVVTYNKEKVLELINRLKD